MLSKAELLMRESDISDKSENNIQDKARLIIIEQLSAQGFYNDADNLVCKLNFSNFEDEARVMISKYRASGVVRLTNHIPSKFDHIEKTKEAPVIIDPEIEFKNILNYLKINRTRLTVSRVNHIKWRIHWLKDMWLKKTLFKRLDDALAEYQISLKEEELQYKQRESNRIKKLELEGKKVKSFSNQKQIILSEKIKKGKKSKTNTQFSKAERKRLFKIWRLL